ncbi:MAG: TPM domain-containing protein [Firmicutes bacterium]|nr:TPM domain-containing protein [Bacillota bacterium]
MKETKFFANIHILRFVSALLLILVLAASPLAATAALGGVIGQSDSFYVADYADVITADTEQYIIEKNADLEQLCGGQIVVAAVDFLDGMDIEDYAYKLFSDWEIGDADKKNGVLLLLAIGEENYWCMQGRGLENKLTSGDIDDILWDYLEEDFAAGDYDAGVRSVFDALYDRIADIYGMSGQGTGSSGANGNESGYTAAADSFKKILKIVIIITLIIVVLFIISTSSNGKRRRPVVFIPTSRPSRPPRTTRSTGAGIRPSRPSSSRSSFSGGSRSSSRGGGMGRGGGGSSRGGGAGRRGR